VSFEAEEASLLNVCRLPRQPEGAASRLRDRTLVLHGSSPSVSETGVCHARGPLPPVHSHVHVFEAVCVIVQYQMDNGAELFQT
jgi:hypothetical protein